MNYTRRILFVLLISTIAIKTGLTFSQTPLPSVNYEKLRESWLHSQYNLGVGYEFYGNMMDEELYTYAALEYISGKDPTAVNFEHPPLAKYLLGFSYRFLGNILFVQFAASIVILMFVYLLARRLSLSPLLSAFPPLILAFDSLFIERSTTVNLDLLQLLFLVIALWFLTSDKHTPRSLFLLGASIGAVTASKVFFSGFLLLVFSLTVLFFKKIPGIRKAFVSLVIGSLAVYLVCYLIFFLSHSPLEFVTLHINILRFYRSYLPNYPWFEIWRILLLGKWRTWFATPAIQPVSLFWIAWPISTALAFSLAFRKGLWKLPLSSATILLSWTVVYLLYSSVHVVFPGYLLFVLPLLYVLGVSSLLQTKLFKPIFVKALQKVKKS